MSGDGEATEAEIKPDRLLALRTAWASLTGHAVWIHPVGLVNDPADQPESRR